MESFSVGPFALPTRPILFLVAVLIAFAVGNGVAKRRGANVERALWAILFVSIAIGRLASLSLYWRSYAATPWAAFDLRDGGIDLAAAITTAVLMAALLGLRNRAWRRPLLASVLAGFVFWGGTTIALEAGKAPVFMPELSLTALDGNAISLQSFAGRPVIINLWASWCPPCRREMPMLLDAQKTHKDIVFIFANQGEEANAVRAYVDAQALQPENVVLDPTGSIARHVILRGCLQRYFSTGTADLPTCVWGSSLNPVWNSESNCSEQTEKLVTNRTASMATHPVKPGITLQ
jgi:thiol-disulfide isomerase/thioredoxin